MKFWFLIIFYRRYYPTVILEFSNSVTFNTVDNSNINYIDYYSQDSLQVRYYITCAGFFFEILEFILDHMRNAHINIFNSVMCPWMLCSTSQHSHTNLFLLYECLSRISYPQNLILFRPLGLNGLHSFTILYGYGVPIQH